MELTKEQQALLDGEQGPVVAKVVKTLVMYGECFGAQKMAPVTSEKGHLVTSFGLSMMSPVFELMDELISADLLGQPFSVDPRPLDPNVPQNFLQKTLFGIMYKKQADYEAQLDKLGLMGGDAFTCTCYLDEVGNKPQEGDILSWAESSAVVYANSVLGARCNRNSGIIELFGSLVGFVPYFGLLTDDGRKATWVIEVDTEERPEAQVLGSAIGMKVMEDVPYIKGLDKWFGGSLSGDARDYLKDMGAATASNGAVGLFHVANLTPEAKAQGEALLTEGAQVYKIDDAELRRVQESYPIIWKDASAKPKLCFVGCPHLTENQLQEWTEKLTAKLKRNRLAKVVVPTVFTAAPAVVENFKKTSAYKKLADTGVVVSSICPLMYMNNPLCNSKPTITSSNKLRTYTKARYYKDAEILELISGGGVS
ncbi:MAG: aconitase X catalytic domain-containing protein [Coriobacteriia bacterium]|nr:aconitase X catalytic domain-containing protein [Coriobacteriia bacterium]